MTTQNQIENTNIANAGANSNITSMTGLNGTLQAPTGVASSTGALAFTFSYVVSAVNYIGVSNNTTGNTPFLSASGTDTNIQLQLTGKGTGGVLAQGTSTNNNAPGGYIGEFISSVIASASHVTFSGGLAHDLTSISLTAGDWDVWGNITYDTVGAGTSIILGWISTTSATFPDASLYTAITATVGSGSGITVPMRRISIAATTTVYITGYLQTANSSTACGGIYARRAR